MGNSCILWSNGLIAVLLWNRLRLETLLKAKEQASARAICINEDWFLREQPLETGALEVYILTD